jgi:hypothetical protein
MPIIVSQPNIDSIVEQFIELSKSGKHFAVLDRTGGEFTRIVRRMHYVRVIADFSSMEFEGTVDPLDHLVHIWDGDRHRLGVALANFVDALIPAEPKQSRFYQMAEQHIVRHVIRDLLVRDQTNLTMGTLAGMLDHKDKVLCAISRGDCGEDRALLADTVEFPTALFGAQLAMREYHEGGRFGSVNAFSFRRRDTKTIADEPIVSLVSDGSDAAAAERHTALQLINLTAFNPREVFTVDPAQTLPTAFVKTHNEPRPARRSLSRLFAAMGF